MLEVRMSQAPTVPPRWLAIVAWSSLAVVLSMVGVSAFRIVTSPSPISSQHDTSPPRTEVSQKARGEPNTARVRVNDWTSKLLDSTCEPPCLGGSACISTGNKPCPSRYSCIPGDRDDRLEPDMPLDLYLAALVGREGKSDACTSMKNASVCFTPASSNQETCVSLGEACAAGRSSTPVPILARDLVSDGVVLRVRMESGRKPVVLTGRLEYGTPLRRVGLCTGFKAGGLVGTAASDVKFITFFIEPRAAKGD